MNKPAASIRGKKCTKSLRHWCWRCECLAPVIKDTLDKKRFLEQGWLGHTFRNGKFPLLIKFASSCPREGALSQEARGVRALWLMFVIDMEGPTSPSRNVTWKFPACRFGCVG